MLRFDLALSDVSARSGYKCSKAPKIATHFWKLYYCFSSSSSSSIRRQNLYSKLNIQKKIRINNNSYLQTTLLHKQQQQNKSLCIMCLFCGHLVDFQNEFSSTFA